ncbi:hypothetical protein K432DRAFT_427031 [Lepidopterella palustris CBS 459.81]|uniref:Uncharacterized protein n=1 Tax=Lepidopterella palustris CBS 459.81 TaxID=1314670 RepID=A0A8E2JDV7_9PEZI|nr:hypothetical protein K432DRAFT_427031 [Lepidopterella palustris CBS 459.81]
MAFLRNISERFWSYVSPRKTQQRRNKPFKVPPTPRNPLQNLNPRSMSPTTRVGTWKLDPTTPSAGAGADERPLTPTSLERPYTDFEGDTLIDELIEELSDEEAFDANEETIVVDEDKYEAKAFDPENERLRREEQGKELRAAGWSEDAIFIFQKLGMRGFEPLMPDTWAMDFVMMPTVLFTKNLSKAFIKPAYGNDFRGAKALRQLLELGARVRDSIISKAPRRTPEEVIRRGISAYIKWATTDGKVDASWNIPILAIESASKTTHISIIEENMKRKLGNLGAQFRDAFRVRPSVERHEGKEDEYHSEHELTDWGEFSHELPTLYGIVLSHTVMGMVSYDILAETPSLRTVAMFDFGKDGYDVWNSLAVAILVVHCRNRMMELKGALSELSSTAESDPDA